MCQVYHSAYRVATAIEKLNSKTFLGHFPELFKAISTYVSVIGIACILVVLDSG